MIVASGAARKEPERGKKRLRGELDSKSWNLSEKKKKKIKEKKQSKKSALHVVSDITA